MIVLICLAIAVVAYVADTAFTAYCLIHHHNN